MPTSVRDAGEPVAPPVGGSDVSAQRLLDNSMVNAAASMLSLALSLVLLPIMVKGLGSVAFGVWALALMLTVSGGYLTLLDLGLQQSAVRLMADARRLGDAQGLRELFVTTLALFVVVAVPVAGAVVALAGHLAAAFDIPAGLRGPAVLAFQLVGAHVLFDLPALAPRALLESGQRFLIVRAIELGRSVVLTAAIIALLAMGHGLVAVAAASLAASGLTAASYLLVAGRTEAVTFSPGALSPSRARALLTFGGPLFLLRILSVVYRQMDKIILAVAVSLVAVAHYEIAARVQAGMVVLMGAVGAALFPAATLLRKDPARLRELYLCGTSYFIAVFLPATLVIFVCARPLIVGWVGEENVDAVPLVRLFYVWLAFATLDAVATTLLTALGRLRPLVWCTTAWVASNLAVSLALVGPLGAPGVLVGSVVTYVPLIATYTVLCLRELDIAPAEWFRRVVRPNVPGAVAQGALLVVLLPLLSPRLPGLVTVAVAGLMTYPVSLWIYVRLGLDAEERARFVGLLRSTLKRRRTAVG